MPRQNKFGTAGFEGDQERFIAKQIIKVEMTKRNMGYRELAAALGVLGVVEEEKALRNKVARGTFSAAFLITCMMAMHVEKIDLEPWLKTAPEILAEVRARVAAEKAAGTTEPG